jgi:double-stranded uracil-DNA glycosylase
MNKIISFSPITSNTAKVLILGSIPGQISLEKHQYYGHPRNSFWYIMEQLFGIDSTLDYDKRVILLQKTGISVWDVLQTCVRQGSLDSAIQESTIIANDFQSFYANHPNIKSVFFNGAKAEQVYKKQVMPSLSQTFKNLEYFRLPSTSPALASLNRDEKLLKWQIVKEKMMNNDECFQS